MTIIIDPGHGMSNRRSGVFDPGAVAGPVREADIAMIWANELRSIINAAGHKVIRTRRDNNDPCPVSRRDDIARSYRGDIMISLHCNAADGTASGTEVFYRGEDDQEMAKKLSAAVSSALGIKDRGAKTERDSQHPSLAVMDFDKCWLIEIGFIDNPVDCARMRDPMRINKTCNAISKIILP